MTHAPRRYAAIVSLASIGAVTAVSAAAVPPSGAAVHHRHARGTVHVASLRVGKALVDAAGRTLYVFSPDAHHRPRCTGGCAAAWPPLLVHGHAVAGPGAKRSLLGTVRIAGGKQQATYHGWPLYTYVGDAAPGQANGQGVSSYGGKWSTISPAGAPSFAHTAGATSTATTSGAAGSGW